MSRPICADCGHRHGGEYVGGICVGCACPADRLPGGGAAVVPDFIVGTRWNPFRTRPYVKGSVIDHRCSRCACLLIVAPITAQTIAAYPQVPVICPACLREHWGAAPV